ncbi:MAG: glycine cleavage system aminomethyltransferase GcvT [Bacteroidaceae bacterium]|nr:glycine cleavage system aminomethyltransferase GcvT [Bacteroidaceae bacterium]
MKQTCLHAEHLKLGAQMSPFAGFDMPIQYTNITDEHNAVRQACGVFDVSHMGEVRITGADAERFVQHIFTNDVAGAPIGKIFYGMMLYPDGGCVDDLLVYKMGEQDFFLVINAANIDKDVAWMQQQREGFDINFDHQSDAYGQLAIQGPEAESVVEQVLGIACADLKFYEAKELPAPAPAQGRGDLPGCEQVKTSIPPQGGVGLIISRTGYTGEDGFEIYAAPDVIVQAWQKLIASGRCKPCGLGCRDTLRFEVGLPLYGDELSPTITPVMAGLAMFCKLDKDFIGRDALARQKAEGPATKLVGIELEGKAIPRHGYTVLTPDGSTVGEVTTGYHAISVDKSVCMALVRSECAALGTPLLIQIRKKTFPGTVVRKRFYDKHYKK